MRAELPDSVKIVPGPQRQRVPVDLLLGQRRAAESTIHLRETTTTTRKTTTTTSSTRS